MRLARVSPHCGSRRRWSKTAAADLRLPLALGSARLAVFCERTNFGGRTPLLQALEGAAGAARQPPFCPLPASGAWTGSTSSYWETPPCSQLSACTRLSAGAYGCTVRGYAHRQSIAFGLDYRGKLSGVEASLPSPTPSSTILNYILLHGPYCIGLGLSRKMWGIWRI